MNMSFYLVLFVLCVALPIGIVLFVRGALFGNTKANAAQAQHLVATGRKARATILRVDPTGVVVNHINLQCLVQFQMTPLDGGPPFAAQKKMMISQTAMPRVGDVWPAWFDAADLTQFAVGMPDGASMEQIPIFREFGIKHPLDSAPDAPSGTGGDPGGTSA
jgi:hypothetical protein